jgi:N4-gp56 family major capsid protein
MYSLNLSKKLRMAVQPMVKFRQFCDVKDATQQGLHKGDTFHWNVYQNVATQGSSMTETATVPKTNFTITQGTLTITEYGNSVPFTSKLDNLSEHPVTEIINKVLKQDATKAFDIAAHAQFNATLLQMGVASGTASVDTVTNGTSTMTISVAIAKEHIGIISNQFKERNIPPYTGEDYYAIAWPTTFSSLKDDLEAIQVYTAQGFQFIMNGEMGRYRNFRFVEQTNIPKGGAVDSTTWNAWTGTADAWTNATVGGGTDWAFFMGEDTVAEAIAIPEEMRGKIPSDFGRSKGIAWYYLGGFGIVHNVAGAVQNRVAKWESAE